jgi:chemotaxis protein MotB
VTGSTPSSLRGSGSIPKRTLARHREWSAKSLPHNPMSNRDEEPEVASERWLLTYSDMITLLLALFVILFAISSVNKAKFAELKTDLHQSFNGSSPSTAQTGQGQSPSTTVSPTSTTTPQSANNSVAAIEAQLKQALGTAGLLSDVQLSTGANGLTLGFVAEKTFYSTDSAQLSPVGTQIVDVAASVLIRHPNSINVDGYTDNEPITGGPYRDNWELSAERAVVVVEQLQNVGHVNPTQLYAVSFGQYHPLVPNSSPAQQAQNRRVDIVISPLGQKVQLP